MLCPTSHGEHHGNSFIWSWVCNKCEGPNSDKQWCLNLPHVATLGLSGDSQRTLSLCHEWVSSIGTLMCPHCLHDPLLCSEQKTALCSLRDEQGNHTTKYAAEVWFSFGSVWFSGGSVWFRFGSVCVYVLFCWISFGTI